MAEKKIVRISQIPTFCFIRKVHFEIFLQIITTVDQLKPAGITNVSTFAPDSVE